MNCDQFYSVFRHPYSITNLASVQNNTSNKMSAESDMEYSDNDGDDYDYYGEQDDCDMEAVDRTKSDPEYFLYTCLRVEEVEKLLNESIELLSNSLQITPSLAKVRLPMLLLIVNVDISVVYHCNDGSNLVCL